MTHPFFYTAESYMAGDTTTLPEDISKHMIGVLRMKKEEKVNLTDGKGNLFFATITDDHKKHCQVRILETVSISRPVPEISIAISLVKNTARLEWFLEKATEIGITEVIPLLCERTEKERFRFDRMNGILISAMLQSQQTWLPVLREPIAFQQIQNWLKTGNDAINYIAHCEEGSKETILPGSKNIRLICIGPEGDFTPGEISLAITNGFKPVSLGNTRLRTETAGMVAAVLLNQ